RGTQPVTAVAPSDLRRKIRAEGRFVPVLQVGAKMKRHPGDALGMVRSRRWTHNNAAETIGLNCVRKPSQFLVPLQLAPALQIECRLIFLSWKLDPQRHRQRYMDRGSSLARENRTLRKAD